MTPATPALPPEPARRLRRWHAWLVVWRVHRWLGLVGGALLILMSASGSLLVVHDEIERIIERPLHVAAVRPGATAVPLADIIRTAATSAPASHQLFRIMPAAGPGDTHRVLFRDPAAGTRWTAFVEPASGRLLWSGPDLSLFTSWLLALHMHLHFDRAGYGLTAVAGIALTLLALTGLIIHRDRIAQLWRHPFRLSLGWRVAMADLHKWVGLFTLYFPLVLGVTGTIYCISALRAAPPKAVASRFDPAGLAALEPMFAQARDRLPGGQVIRAQLPAQAGGKVTVLLLHREAPVWQKFSRVEFDAATGALRAVHAAHELPAGAQFRSMLAPLHFGFYGAPWVKWAYFVGGLAPGLLAATGAAIWWLRRSQGNSRR